MAAPSTEDLVIQMRVDMGRLEADLREANRRLDDLGNAGQGAGNSVQSGMTNAARGAAAFAAAAAAAAAAAVTIAASVNQAVTELNRLAGQTGMTTDALQYYAAGARMLGVEQEELGQIFQDTQEKIGDFLDTGAGEMVDFFEQVAPLVGLTAEEFRHLGGAEALQLVYDSMEKVGLSSNQIIFQLQSIASESTALIPLLKNGGEGFRLFGDEAQRAGAIMSKDVIDAATKSKVQFELLKNELRGAANEIFIATAPAMQFLGEQIIGVSRILRSGEIQAALGGILTGFNILGDGAGSTFASISGGLFNLVLESKIVADTITEVNTLANLLQAGAGLVRKSAVSVAEAGQVIAGRGNEALYKQELANIDAVTNARTGAVERGIADAKRLRAERIAEQQAENAERKRLQEEAVKILTDTAGVGGSGGMRTTQAERDKQAAADKANAARLEADRKAAATQLEQQKQAAEDLRKSLLAQLMTERELLAAEYKDKEAESLRLNKGLQGGEEAHRKNMLAIRENYHTQIAALDERELQAEIEAAAAAGMAGAEAHEQDMAARIARAEQLREIMMQQEGATTEARRAMLLERHLIEEALILEQFEAQLISKEERSQRLLDLDKKYKEDSLNVTRELFEGQHELEALYQDTTLKNAANFFAMDLGNFSKHSRKVFELTKAAKTAQVALSIPEAVSDAFNAGNRIAGPALGAAYAASALATKLGQLRDIRAATFGGGSGGGSSGGAGGSGGTVPAAQDQQQPQIERFVNLSIIGESNDITSIGNVRNLIERINTEIQNGAVLRVN